MKTTEDTEQPGLSIGVFQPGDPRRDGSAERPPQDELNLFLQMELSHSLGSYGVAVQGMRALLGRMTARGSTEPWGALFPRDALARMCDYNEALRANLHMPAELRDDRSALREVAVPSQHPDPGESLGGEDMRYQWVLDYYATAVVSLDFATGNRIGTPTEEQLRFGKNLKVVHDPQRRGRSKHSKNALARGRISRNTHRLERAMHLFGLEPHADRAKEILADHLGMGNDGAPLHTQVIGALVEAHIRMHRAEHLISHSFGDKVRRRSEIDQAVDHELKRSLALNTFAYVVSRTAPWIFAARAEERDYVIENFKDCCQTLTPTYCTWLSNQVGLLALQRRAFTWLVLDDGEKAHNDFQKVKRLVRGLERQLEERILRPAGEHVFLRGISAFADHHSGRLYRVQHAHSAALRHFDRAALQLTRMEKDADVIDLLRNSRWRVHLLVSQAKASYELGLIKQTLVCFIRAWRAFLELADTESSARANFQTIDSVIEWLEVVAPDAEVNKVDLTNRLAPLIRQIQVVRGPTHLRVMAADILMRLAHVLFMLKLPRVQGEQVKRNKDGEPREDHELAYRCLLQAARLDRSQTLIAADLLKARQWTRRKENSKDKVPETAGLDVQWPGGGGQFEEAARIVEYVLQSWLQLTESQENASPEEKIARDLLASFLVHTDSTNVKLAQVYRYLMEDSAPVPERDLPTNDVDRLLRAAIGPELGGADGNTGLKGRDSVPKTPYLELVCLRRYSSFFPFVPRPMAFRVVGGGYFVRIYDVQEKDTSVANPFGIAIDPGPNFIDNLYRSGYCLADIHMILVTHDHADHMAALDPILALLGYRDLLGVDTFREDKKLIILGNDSVTERYKFYNDEGNLDAVKVLSFQKWEAREDGDELELLLAPPQALRIEAVSTWGHEDAGGNGAQGVLLSVGADPGCSSVLFTSDMGPIDEEQRRLRRKPDSKIVSPGKSIEEAIEEATIVVVHVSAIPLPQLRVLAGLEQTPPSFRKETEVFEGIWKALYTQIEEKLASEQARDRTWALRRRFLVRQLQFGFHSSPIKNTDDPSSELRVSPLSPCDELGRHSERHLYLDGLLSVAKQMNGSERKRLLVIGELHEELGTFRTRIARALNEFLFEDCGSSALTADIGLTARVGGSSDDAIEILCTTCALDNDLVDIERFHAPDEICEVCVKGEDEGIFYNCKMHDPQRQPQPAWVERVERYDPFGR